MNIIDIKDISPAVPIILASIACVFIPNYKFRKGISLFAPILALFLMLTAERGLHGIIPIFGFELITFRLNALSTIWGLIFILASFISVLYGLHERNRMTDCAGLLYAGSAIGAVFSGDLLTLFVFWELTAISSVFLIWANKTGKAYKAGIRYLAIHIASGVFLLAGSVMIYHQTSYFDFGFIGLDSLGGYFILIAFGIKCAFPLLHNWLQDSYPKASVTGAVWLSIFTTKMAVYALAVAFPGESILIYIGAIMTVFPIFFAVIENDLRKVLSYSLNNQLGFMVVGIGIGTTLSLNGTAAHAFTHILYKALLFMSMGAVLYRTGTVKASELGGLFRTMPLTAIFCMIGAASISAFPLFSGFVSKSMILAAAVEEHLWLVWAVLLFASAGVLEHSGIKIPYFAFLGHDSGKRPKEAPWNMLLAMGIISGLCLFLAWPFGGYQLFYTLLPFTPSDHSYQPYSWDHVIEQMQLLFAAMLAFAVLMRFRLYLPEKPGEILDFDWIYRRFGYQIVMWLSKMLYRLFNHIKKLLYRMLKAMKFYFYEACSPSGSLSEAFPTGAAAIWAALLLGIMLVISFFAVT